MQANPLNPEDAAMASAAAGETGGDAEGLALSRLWVYGACAVLATGLMLYAQTWAFTDDEGFHLLAAQLIKGGMRPYLD